MAHISSHDALVNMQRSSKAAFWQKNAHLSEHERQAKWTQYLKWISSQATGGKAQLSSSVPQKRHAAHIGLETGSKRPSIVGSLSCYLEFLV